MATKNELLSELAMLERVLGDYKRRLHTGNLSFADAEEVELDLKVCESRIAEVQKELEQKLVREKEEIHKRLNKSKRRLEYGNLSPIREAEERINILWAKKQLDRILAQKGKQNDRV